MESLKKELKAMIESEIIVQQLGSEKQPTRIQAASSIIRAETLQNNQISESKDHTESIKQLVQESRIEFLKKVESVYQNNNSQEGERELSQYIQNYKLNYGFLGENRLYPWQLISSLETLKQNDGGLSFISDKNSFQNGGLVYSILKDAFKLQFGVDLVNIFSSHKDDRKSQLQLDDQLIENIWNSVINSQTKNSISFLNLEHLTPTKIIFIAKLQKYYESQKDSNPSLNIIIYSDDILSAQLKELCKPQVEIALDLHRMPQKIWYAEDLQICQQSKIKKIESIVTDSLKKYKQTLMRYDFLIFVKNSDEAAYLKEHHLNMVKEKLNVIDLTGVDIETEEKPFFEEEFRKQWMIDEQIRKQKQEEERIRLEEEQRIKLEKELKIKQQQEEILKIEQERLRLDQEQIKQEQEQLRKDEEKLKLEEVEERLKLEEEEERYRIEIAEKEVMQQLQQEEVEKEKIQLDQEGLQIVKEEILIQEQEILDQNEEIEERKNNDGIPKIEEQVQNLANILEQQDVQIEILRNVEIQPLVQNEVLENAHYAEFLNEIHPNIEPQLALIPEQPQEPDQLEQLVLPQQPIQLQQAAEPEQLQVEIVVESEEDKLKREEQERLEKEEKQKQLELEEKQKEQERYEQDLFEYLNKHKQNLYKKNEFNVFIAKSHKQLKYHKLGNILVQIDTGEAFKVYFMDTKFESVPVVSSKITREEALKRERLMGHQNSCEIHRLYGRKEFLRLQKRDFLNVINLEQFRSYSEIEQEKCQEKQAIRILLHVMINLSENWYTCQSETSAHVSIIWSRMGDVFSIHNSILLIPSDSPSPFTYSDLFLKSNIEKNQINSTQFDHIIQEILNINSDLNLQTNPIKVLQSMDYQRFSELTQQIAIQKYYKNLCVYSGHRRHGFRHFESSNMLNYAELSSMNLIQERPFLIIPLQLQINSKNQYEIKQCIAIDHLFLLENAPSQYIEKYSLRLLKRQSLNLHEIEYYGISDALFQYFEANKNIIKEMESKYECYYEPNHHMDTITIHCDSSQKEKVEKYFKEHMDEAQKFLSEEILEVSHGNNSILKIQKGGVIKEVIILENDHIFIADNLPPTVKEQDLIDLFSEYGDILSVKFYTDPNSQNAAEKTISAEILVSETEDSSFFVETFNQIDFQGRTLQLRLKNHSYKIHTENNSTTYHNIFRWQTWKSKLTGRIEFEDESSVAAFVKTVQNKLTIDGKEIKAEIDKIQNKVVNLSGLFKHTDEQTLKQSLSPELQKNVVDRIVDVDRGISKASLIHVLNKVYQEQHHIDWVKKKDNGFIEAKINFSKNFIYKMNNYHTQYDGKADVLGQQKLYVQRHYTQTFNYEHKLMSVVQMILKGNQELVQMQQKNEIKLKEKIVRPIPSKQDFLVILKCTDEALFNKANTIISAILTPKLLDLRNIKLDLASLFDEDDQVDYSQIFTEIGQKKLREIEKQYPVYFKINLIKEDVRVFCTDAIYDLINKEVEYFLRQSVRVKIPISGKNIRNILGIDGKGLEEFKNKSQLCKIQLDYISKDVYMEGNSKKVDQAKNALLALLEEKNSSACFNNMPYSYEDCQVCSNTITTGYRLQGCGHKFCISCIMFVIDNSLNDINSLPIRCPFCSKAVIMKDLKALMNDEQLEKMTRMSLNHYVQNNFQEVTFCVNENCKSVHSSKLTKYTCYECKKTYCSKCSAEYHYGMTCSFYQETEAKNIEFLIKEGARKCPSCSVFIIRIDGCYRVECRRCNMHICWKDNCMKFYDNASECYSHLDEKHGGYW